MIPVPRYARVGNSSLSAVVSVSPQRFGRDQLALYTRARTESPFVEDATMARVTAVFDTRAQAERAIADLRSQGIADAQMSIVSRRSEDVEVKRAPGYR